MDGGRELEDRQRGDGAAGLAETHVEVENRPDAEDAEQARVGGLGRAVAGDETRLEVGVIATAIPAAAVAITPSQT